MTKMICAEVAMVILLVNIHGFMIYDVYTYNCPAHACTKGLRMSVQKRPVAGRILLILQKLELHHMASLELLFCKNWKSTKLHGVTFVKGTPGVSVLWEQQIVKNCFDACPLLQFQKFHKKE